MPAVTFGPIVGARPCLVDDVLPMVDGFVDDLAADFVADRINDYEGFVDRCRTFYTGEMLARNRPHRVGLVTHGCVPGRGHALAHNRCDGLAARLRGVPDAANPRRHLMDWAVLLHDLAKKPDGRGRDDVHVFRSAAVAARVLPGLGFAVTEAVEAEAETWYVLVESACRYDALRVPNTSKTTNIWRRSSKEQIASTGQTPWSFSKRSRFISPSLLSRDWPARTPLTWAEEQRFIDLSLAPVLLATMLADHGGWNTFDATTLGTYQDQTRAVFERFVLSISYGAFVVKRLFAGADVDGV